MKKLLVSLSAGATLLVVGAVATPAVASEALAKSSGCLNCHAVDKKKVGPALKDVAAAWKKAGVDADKGAAMIKSNHKSVKASDADLKTLAGWVLTL